MKGVPTLRLVPGILIVLGSCSDEFLIREPLGVGAGSMMNSPDGVEAVLTGTYAALRGKACSEDHYVQTGYTAAWLQTIVIKALPQGIHLQ